VTIHQDVLLHTALINDGPITYEFAPNRYGWLQVARGEVEVGGEKLATSDGLAISGERSLSISGRNAEVLLFDLN